MQKDLSSLVEDFQEYFDLQVASEPAQMEQVYRVRYRVYCQEFGYEPADAFPDEQETDPFDAFSVHCLITHRASQVPAGCVRLVSAGEGTLMPMEHFCGDSLDTAFIDSLGAARDSMCEFSRLAVDGAFRRRAGERASRYGEFESLDWSQRELRTFPLIAVATFIAGFAASELIGRTNCFAMMEPFLPRLLQRSGIVVHRAGEDVDYHGMRAPYFIRTRDAVDGMPDELADLYNVIHKKFSASLAGGAGSAVSRAPAAPALRPGSKPDFALPGAAWAP